MRSRTPRRALDVWERGRRDRRPLQLAVPRAPDLHDGGSAQHLVLHAPPVLRQEHRAHRRPHHQHRRDDPLPRHRRDPGDDRPKNDARTTPTIESERLRKPKHDERTRVLIVEDEEPLTLAPALQSRSRRLRGRHVARGDEAEIRLREQASRPRPARLDAAGPVRHRALPPHPRAAGDRAPARHHAHRPRRGGRPHPRPRHRRRRLHRQAVLGARAAGPRSARSCAAPSPRTSRTLLVAGDLELDRETTASAAPAASSISDRPSSGCSNS